jgi:hypothetical protein
LCQPRGKPAQIQAGALSCHGSALEQLFHRGAFEASLPEPGRGCRFCSHGNGSAPGLEGVWAASQARASGVATATGSQAVVERLPQLKCMAVRIAHDCDAI